MGSPLDDVDRAILRGDYDDGTTPPPLTNPLFSQVPSEEELLKTSPAMFATQKMMEGMTLGETMEDLRRRGIEVDVEGDFPYADPGPDPNFPDRPDHPDFRRLSAIIQQMDALAEEGNPEDPDKNMVEVLMPGEVDPNSVMYMAKQRALRGEERLSEDGDFYAKSVIMWLDAFTAGVKFGREQAVRAVLDDGIEGGSHRFGRGG